MKATLLIGAWLLLMLAALFVGSASVIQAAPSASAIAVQPTLTQDIVPDQPPILITASDFLTEEWPFSVEASTGATYTVSFRPNGGPSNLPFRFISHSLPPVMGNDLATIHTTHIYTAETYDPSTRGAIESITHSESGRILSFPFPEAFTTSQPVVLQSGRIFRSTQFMRFIAANSSHPWEFKSLSDLVAADFVAIDGSGDIPDFSENGAPLQFGLSRSNSRGSTLPPVPADQPMVIDQGVAWVRWTITRQPIVEVNHPPQAVDDIIIINGNQSSLPILEFINVARNDTDPDLDILKIVEVTQPLFGSAGELSDRTIVYQLTQPRSTDSFGYTISDDEFTSSASVQIYVDCACTALCLNNLELPEAASGQAAHDIDLPLIYRVRDQVLQSTPDGRRYVELYYESNPEILVNIVTNELLRSQALATIEFWQGPLRSLTDGDGSATITQGHVDALQKLLDDLAVRSSPELQAIIAGELQRLGDLDDYVGMSVKEAKRQAIGDATLHLPLVGTTE